MPGVQADPTRGEPDSDQERAEVRDLYDLLEDAYRFEDEDNFRAALKAYKELQKRTYEINDLDTRDSILQGLAYSNFQSRNLKEAVEGYRRLLDFREQQTECDDEAITESRYDLARAIAQTKNPGDAIKLYREVLSSWKAKRGDEDAKVLELRHNLAYALGCTLEYREALDINLKVLAIRKKIYADPNDLDICKSRYQVAINFYYMGDYRRALLYINSNTSLPGRPGDADFQDIMKDTRALGQACKEKQNRNGEAKASKDLRAREVVDQTHGSRNQRSSSVSVPVRDVRSKSPSAQVNDAPEIARRKSTGSRTTLRFDEKRASSGDVEGSKPRLKLIAERKNSDQNATRVEQHSNSSITLAKLDRASSKTRARSSNSSSAHGSESKASSAGSTTDISRQLSNGFERTHRKGDPRSAVNLTPEKPAQACKKVRSLSVDNTPAIGSGSKKPPAISRSCTPTPGSADGLNAPTKHSHSHSKSDSSLLLPKYTASQTVPVIQVHQTTDRKIEKTKSDRGRKSRSDDATGNNLLLVPDASRERVNSDPEQHGFSGSTSETSPAKVPPTLTRTWTPAVRQPGELYGYLDMKIDETSNPDLDVQPPKSWLSLFETRTLAVLEPGRSRNVFPSGKDELRVAILDTGVDMSHREIKAQKSRLKERLSFLSAGTPGDTADTDDTHGHGTHATALLLRLVPRAKIYVGRVATQGDPDPKAVARAIEHAHRVWKVKIISMAFGFPRGGRSETKEYRDGIDDIEKAIWNAAAEHILMFGAACNSGDLDKIAFPARMPQVICVHSATAGGKPSDFTPSPNPRNYNFSILGENVSSAWPRSKGGKTKRMSGTSTAVTIAAAVGATVLYLTRLQDEGSLSKETLGAVRERLEKQDAMCKLLEHMSDTVEGYSFIKPWKLIGIQRSTHDEPEAVRKEILGEIAKFLRDEGFTIP